MVGLRFTTGTIAVCSTIAMLGAVAESTNSTEVGNRRLATSPYYQVCGVDIVGGDTKSVKFYAQNGCTTICDQPNTPCDAATWTNHDGGTCWLKRIGRQNPLPNVNINPAATSFFHQSHFTVAAAYPVKFVSGFDMPGNDIGSRRGSEPECHRYCHDNSKCFGYVWTDYEGGTCWLKSKANNLVPNAGAFITLFARSDAEWHACRDLY